MGLAIATWGASIAVLELVWVSALQEGVPADLLGRVSSVNALGSYALLPVGYGIAGIVADRLGPAAVFLLGGAISVVLIGTGLLSRRSGLAQMRSARWHAAVGLLIVFIAQVIASDTLTTRASPATAERWNTSYGNDHFGHWIVDRFGLPAFQYADNEARDPAAAWNDGYGRSTAFWHQLGNDRIVANAYSDGYVQLWDGERQYGYTNQYDAATQHFAGGYGYLDDGQHAWSTLYRDRPSGASYRRIFGMGYYEKDERAYNLEVRQTSFAPFGTAPVLLDEVRLTNLGTTARTIRYLEYWDVNPEVIHPGLGSQGATVRESPSSTEYDAGSHTLLALPATGATPMPHVVFLSALVGSVSSYDTSVRHLFGQGGRAQPSELRRATLSNTVLPHGGLEATLAMETRVVIPPGASRRLLYAYGYGDPETIVPVVRRLRAGARRALTVSEARWRASLPVLRIPRDTWLERETAWNYYYLRSSQTYDDAWHTSFVDQGYTYLYEWGLNIAYRDPIAAILPMVDLAPSLARQALLFGLRAQPAKSDIPYGFDHGTAFAPPGAGSMRSDDLDLWLLWATSEYVLATRDFAFLRQREPYYHTGTSATVFHHLETAYAHQIKSVGFGAHGEVRMLSGDWSDGEAQNGSTESTPTTAQAAWVFSVLGQMARAAGHRTFAAEVTAEGVRLRHVVMQTWTGHWFNRGYKGRRPYGVDSLYLNAQPWAILAGAATPAQAATVAGSIRTLLSTPSPIGMASESPSQGYGPTREKPTGNGTTGGIWYALNGPAIWALAAVAPALAYREYKDNTHAAYAQAYPNNWFGVLSGPDSYNSFESRSPGQPFLPFYPVQDDHAHLWQLFDTSALSGIEPTAAGFTIDPHWPFADFSWNSAVIGITCTNRSARGYVHPVAPGTIGMRVYLPKGAASPVTLRLAGLRTRLRSAGGFVTWRMAVSPQQRAVWRLTWHRAISSVDLSRLRVIALTVILIAAIVAGLAAWQRLTRA